MLNDISSTGTAQAARRAPGTRETNILLMFALQLKRHIVHLTIKSPIQVSLIYLELQNETHMNYIHIHL